MSKGFKWIIGIVTFVVLAVVIASFFISGIVEKKIVKALSKDYRMSIGSTHVNVWATSATLHNLELSSKNRAKDSIHVELNRVSVNLTGIYNTLWGDTLKVSSVRLNYPKIQVYKATVDTTQNISKEKHIDKSVYINELEVTNGSISLYSVGDTLQTSGKNFTLLLNHIRLNEQTLKQEIPVQYEFQTARISEFYQRVSAWEELFIKDILADPSSIEVEGLHMKPMYTQKEYIHHIPSQNDWIDLMVANLKVKDYELSLLGDKPRFKAPEIVIDSANLHLYRDKVVPRDFTFKPLYSKMLRDLETDIVVDTLKIHGSSITYEEKLPGNPEAGKLNFSNMEMLIANVNNIDATKKTNITIDCQFLDEAPLHIDWMFDIHHPQDYFEIKGSLGSVDFQELNNFVEPNMNVSVTGKVTALIFNFYGNNTRAKGRLTMKYQDLKVEVFKKKDPKKKNKLFSVLANIFIDSKEEKFKEQMVEAERTQYKSFFNYFWLCIQDGVKKTIL